MPSRFECTRFYSSDRESVIFEETLEKRDSRIAIPKKFVKLVIAYKTLIKNLIRKRMNSVVSQLSGFVQ